MSAYEQLCAHDARIMKAKRQLQQTNPLTETKQYEALFDQLVKMEKERVGLVAKALGDGAGDPR